MQIFPIFLLQVLLLSGCTAGTTKAPENSHLSRINNVYSPELGWHPGSSNSSDSNSYQQLRNKGCLKDSDCSAGLQCRYIVRHDISLCKPAGWEPPVLANDAPIKIESLNLDGFKAQCKQLGFKEKTPDFGSCVLQLNTLDEEKKESVNKLQSEHVDEISDRLGHVVVTDLSFSEREALQIDKGGVLVQNVGNGTAKNSGILQGDVILRIANVVITGLASFEKVVKDIPVGKSVAVLIQRRGSPTFIALKIDR